MLICNLVEAEPTAIRGLFNTRAHARSYLLSVDPGRPTIWANAGRYRACCIGDVLPAIRLNISDIQTQFG